MDRLYWSNVMLHDNEDLVTTCTNVRLYDGDEKKTPYDDGNLILTSHRLIWNDTKDEQTCVSLDLSYIVLLEEESPSFTRSGKIICHLSPASGAAKRGPVNKSIYNHVRWSFPRGGHTEFLRHLRDVHGRQAWVQKQQPSPASKGYQFGNLKTGIAGIERKIQEQHRRTDTSIAVAFEDLDALMVKANEMVTLSKSIASKIEQKQGSITEDETVQFKSYLLSLGIPDPVTRDSHKSTSKYLQELAKQISSSLLQPLKDVGGIMTLPDVYCRINRARGMQLLSPQDLLEACKLLPSLDLPVTLKTYETGVKILQLRSNDDESVAEETSRVVEESTCLSADEYARLVGLSVILAKERLLSAENKGKLCRDDSVEGLRFYPNKFLLESADNST